MDWVVADRITVPSIIRGGLSFVPTPYCHWWAWNFGGRASSYPIQSGLSTWERCCSSVNPIAEYGAPVSKKGPSGTERIAPNVHVC